MTADRDIRRELPSVDRVLQASQDLVSLLGPPEVARQSR